MAQLSVFEGAAINRIAAALEKHLTNGTIDEIVLVWFTQRINESSKAKKIRAMLSQLVVDRRARRTAENAIAALCTEAHQRTLSGLAALSIADVDSIVKDMRALGLEPGDLARAGWRKGLASAAKISVERVDAIGGAPIAFPCRHNEALIYLASLENETPQRRGRELEKILTGVTVVERLGGNHNIVNVGEQIDHTFVLDGHHYIAEHRWTREPQGMPAIRDLTDKVRRKADGTFGVLVSMGGFATSINDAASIGSRLSCVGLASPEIMSVLEGRTTFAGAVRAARAEASTRSTFYKWPT